MANDIGWGAAIINNTIDWGLAAVNNTIDWGESHKDENSWSGETEIYGLAFGPELVTNGGFDTDTDWVKGVDWSITGGEAVKTNASSSSNITQSVDVINGKTYILLYTSKDILGAGNMKSIFGGVFGTPVTSDGEHSDVFVALSTISLTIGIRSVGSTGLIDNVSVKEVL